MVNTRQKYLRENYIARINNVIDYIEVNIGRELTLQELSRCSSILTFPLPSHIQRHGW